MGMMPAESSLRYIDAGHVDTPAGRLDHVVAVSPTHERLGKLNGILIDPVHRQVRYYIVESNGWLRPRRYLVPLTPARLDAEHQAVELDVEADELKRFDEVEADAFPRFSDDDLITALFHSSAS